MTPRLQHTKEWLIVEVHTPGELSTMLHPMPFSLTRTLSLASFVVICSIGCRSSTDAAPAAATATAQSSAAATAQSSAPVLPVTITSVDATHYQVDSDVIARVVLAVVSGKVKATFTGSGYRLSNIQPGSLLARLGVSNGDTIRSVANVALSSPRALEDAYLQAQAHKAFEVKLLRGDETLIIFYKLHRRRYPRAASRSSASPRRPSPRSSALSEDLRAGITSVNDREFKIRRATFERLVSEQAKWMRSARIIPSMKDGTPNGLKFYGIRRRSFFDVLGFKNGDTLKSVNGHSIASPDGALNAYAELKGKSVYTVALMRRGQPLEFTYRIVD